MLVTCRECQEWVAEGIRRCPKCGAKIVDHINRVVGYFTRVSGWNPGKQREYNERKRYLLK